MALAHAETKTGSAGSGASSVSSASMGAGDSTSVYIAHIATRSNKDVTGVSGLGLTWTMKEEQCSGRGSQRIETWYAVGAGTSGAVTASWSGTTNGSAIAVSRYTSGHQSTPLPASTSWSTMGENSTDCASGTDTNDAQGSLTTTVANSLISAGFNTRTGDLTHTSGWTARATNIIGGVGGDETTLSVEDKLITTPAATALGQANNTGTVDWCLAAVEIQEAAAAAAPPPNQLMLTGVGR